MLPHYNKPGQPELPFNPDAKRRQSHLALYPSFDRFEIN